ncbi:hypothetical protein [Mitsuaria sp. 7]|uniref:hypothetical protein n=1 Tax=Mitsuaria sp. 7 TaxID=1658665 RepID=UPI0007DD9CC3|nr:hypothetical protein [Mitsuaria sp. 7]ANH66826.1 hypothetical protein ABE85_03240 [Mitsuaria sp. 7]
MATSTKDLLAQALGASHHGAEARRRATISRAYYAAYHRCREWALSLPRSTETVSKAHGVHEQLIDRLANPPPSCPREKRKVARQLAGQLSALKARRVAADYKLRRAISENEMRMQQSEAQELFAWCDGSRRPVRGP